MFKRIVVLLVFFFMSLFLLAKNTSADVIPFGYYEKQCSPNERAVECSFHNDKLSGPRVLDTCTKYQDNPNFRYLKGHASSFGGEEVYCVKRTMSQVTAGISLFDDFTLLNIIYYARLFFFQFCITILFEVPIFFYFGFRTKKNILSVLFVNLFTVLLFYTTHLIIDLSWLYIFIVEVVIVIYEAYVLYALTGYPRGHVAFATFVANFFSAVIGTYVGIYLYIMLSRLW